MTEFPASKAQHVPVRLEELPQAWLSDALNTALLVTHEKIMANLNVGPDSELGGLLDVCLFDVPAPGHKLRECDTLQCPSYGRIEHAEEVMDPLLRGRRCGPVVSQNSEVNRSSYERALLMAHTCMCFREDALNTYQHGKLRDCDYPGVGGVYAQVPLPVVTGGNQLFRETRLFLPFIVTAHFAVERAVDDDRLGLTRHAIAEGVAQQLRYGMLLAPHIVPQCTNPGGRV